MIKSILRLSRFCNRIDSISFSVQKLPIADAAKSTTGKSFHTSSHCLKEIRHSGQKVKVGHFKYGEAQEGETGTGIVRTQEDLFPDENTPNRLFDNIPYKELPIVNIKSTPNNTIMTLTDYKGVVQAIHSSGLEGYKNARKGTNVAAQQAAISFSETILERGFKLVRVRIQGIGAGRMAAIKGLNTGGISVVSVTDDTRVSWNPPRPRKQRRV